MKEILLTILRNKKTSSAEFRNAAQNLSIILAIEAGNLLAKEKITIQTPLAKTAGYKIKNNIVIVPILRAGLALLPVFLKTFESAKVGFIGLKRDEKTFESKLYYKNIPKISKNDNVIILDPMLATGGSACEAAEILKNSGAKEENMIFAGIVAASQGIAKLKKEFPKIKIIIAGYDKNLTKKKYISPGLGDFGDRFFQTL